jgi:hypothetical protein
MNEALRIVNVLAKDARDLYSQRRTEKLSFQSKNKFCPLKLQSRSFGGHYAYSLA